MDPSNDIRGCGKNLRRFHKIWDIHGLETKHSIGKNPDLRRERAIFKGDATVASFVGLEKKYTHDTPLHDPCKKLGSFCVYFLYLSQ